MAKSWPGSPLAELPHLATFAAVAERGSFTAAASALGITQAAVSQRIGALENELRVALFNRRHGTISLTEAGERLYPYARQILGLHAQARADVSGYRPTVTGELPIAASSVPGECYLPELLSSFHEQYPGVHVQATVSDSSAVIREVVKCRATLGLVGQQADVPSLEYQPLGGDRLVLVVPPGHRLARRKRVALEALAHEPLIIRERGSGTRCALENGLQRRGTKLAALNVALELGSNAAIKDAIRRGLGVAFLSGLAVKRELGAGELRAVSVSGLSLDRRFFLVHLRRRPLTTAASAFMNFALAHPIEPERA
jgi:DNA-binding transcriptional LysR family regulator